MERGADIDEASESERLANQTVWHAGDWTGPISLQPDVKRSAEVLPGDTPKDIIAVPREGVKVGCHGLSTSSSFSTCLVAPFDTHLSFFCIHR